MGLLLKKKVILLALFLGLVGISQSERAETFGCETPYPSLSSTSEVPSGSLELPQMGSHDSYAELIEVKEEDRSRRISVALTSRQGRSQSKPCFLFDLDSIRLNFSLRSPSVSLGRAPPV